MSRFFCIANNNVSEIEETYNFRELIARYREFANLRYAELRGLRQQY